MKQRLLAILSKKNIAIALTVFVVFLLLQYFVFDSLTFSPKTEAQRMSELEITKQKYALSAFVTDGCSGNVSRNWSRVTTELQRFSGDFADRYKEETIIPFEAACVAHDTAYHTGIGGYEGRLLADNQLRADIIAYAVSNASEIQTRTQLSSVEEVLFLYEKIADLVYQGVRIGGAPCTGEPYAWGYGYNNGSCE